MTGIDLKRINIRAYSYERNGLYSYVLIACNERLIAKLYVLCKYLRTYVWHKPIILPGDVVIILNVQNVVLLQKRHDRYWGLPDDLMDLSGNFEETG